MLIDIDDNLIENLIKTKSFNTISLLVNKGFILDRTYYLLCSNTEDLNALANIYGIIDTKVLLLFIRSKKPLSFINWVIKEGSIKIEEEHILECVIYNNDIAFEALIRPNLLTSNVLKNAIKYNNIKILNEFSSKLNTEDVLKTIVECQNLDVLRWASANGFLV